MSCVPVGEYSFAPHKYKGKLDTVALIGETVSHYPSDKARNLILIHPANHPHELHGCISTGLKKDVDVVYRSKNAFGLLIDVINTNKIDKITII